MKKSTKIQLVLITAALASCNRVIIPSMSGTGYLPDPSLTATPAYEEAVPDCSCTQNDKRDTLYYPRNVYYPLPSEYEPYYPGYYYRKGAFWRNHQFVIRGGFGKSSGSAAS